MSGARGAYEPRSRAPAFTGRRRGRPRRTRHELGARVVGMYAHWLPVFQWLRALSRDVPPAVVAEGLTEGGFPWAASMERRSWGRWARRLTAEPPAALALRAIALHLKLPRATVRQLLREARRQWPGLERRVRGGSLSRRFLAAWRRHRRPWELPADEDRALDAELGRIRRAWERARADRTAGGKPEPDPEIPAPSPR